ncbi:MAG: hypothetical protein H0X30_24300 [Anaerolineae bacterium]|nr:hypothetical protein [Anaerolineae bacterium]
MKTIWRITLFSALILALGLLVLPQSNRTLAQDATSVPAGDLEPTILMKWMQLLYDRVEAEKISAPEASRLYAYAGISGYQSILPGMPDGISMSGQLTSLPDMPQPDEGKIYDWVTVANGSLSTVIGGLFPKSAADTQKAVKSLRDSEAKDRQSEIDPKIIKQSLAYGDTVAKTLLEWAAADNYTETRSMTWETPAGDPSLWAPTAKDMKVVEPFWGQIRPFALYSADACAQQPNLTFDAKKESSFYLQALEIKNMGDNLTDAEKATAQYWEDNPGETGTNAGHWVMIGSQVIDVLQLKLERASMLYALMGISLGDSYISALSLNYQINLLRPVTYIQKYIDPKWQSLVAAPAFPEYPSVHAVVAEAAAEVLTRMFGTVGFTDSSGQANKLDVRSYTSFEAAATESSTSRLYGGVDFRTGIENGMRQGRCIGDNVIDYISLRSLPQGE